LGTEQLSVFASVGDVNPVWQPLANGINYFQGKTASPRLEFYAVQIDLEAPQLQIVVRGGCLSSDGKQTFGTKVSSFVSDNNLIAGINAAPFDVISSREGQPIKNMGVVISAGEMIAPLNPRFDALVFYKSGNAAIVRQAAISQTEDIENAIGGFNQILVNGEAAQRTLSNELRHPRSAAGISADGRYLYLLVIDGRRKGSEGATEYETALLLLALGSSSGLNFDGGGSSALALRANGKTRIVNVPIHGGIPGRERAVAGCIGITMSN